MINLTGEEVFFLQYPDRGSGMHVPGSSQLIPDQHCMHTFVYMGSYIRYNGLYDERRQTHSGIQRNWKWYMYLSINAEETFTANGA